MKLRGLLSSAILAESARWGDAKQPASPRTVTEWINANNSVQTHLSGRRTTIISQLRSRSLFPSINAPAFSQHGGVAPVGYQATITGPSGSTIYYTVDGSDPTSPGATTYTAPVPIDNVQVTLKARARSAVGEWSALTEAIFTLNAVPAVAGKLAISEIHYNPAGSTDDTEFVELINISGSRLVLTGVSFTEAMTFTFGSLTLEAGERVLVVENEAAFRAAYGPAALVAGQWTGALNNDGETIVLLDKYGQEIERIPYGNAAPWPPAANGIGHSLVRIEPTSPARGPADWRQSVEIGGNPGATDRQLLSPWLVANGFSTPFEPSPDGTPALIRFASGQDLHSTAPLIAIARDEANPPDLLVTFQRRLGADEIALTLESSTTLTSWQAFTPGSLEAPITNRSQSGAGVESITVRLPGASDQQFLRLRGSK